jgi:hypothetical protein
MMSVSIVIAIVIVCITMVLVRFDAGVQQFGCWALTNMAICGDDISKRLKKKGVIEVIQYYDFYCYQLSYHLSSISSAIIYLISYWK